MISYAIYSPEYNGFMVLVVSYDDTRSCTLFSDFSDCALTISPETLVTSGNFFNQMVNMIRRNPKWKYEELLPKLMFVPTDGKDIDFTRAMSYDEMWKFIDEGA